MTYFARHSIVFILNVVIFTMMITNCKINCKIYHSTLLWCFIIVLSLMADVNEQSFSKTISTTIIYYEDTRLILMLWHRIQDSVN